MAGEDSLLTALDETLRHQAPLTFAEVASTDHRFFDRCWYGVYAPGGDVGFITGMGAYTNMNVLDGFAAMQRAGRQYNLRLSRSLRPDVTHAGLGPLRVEVVRPLEAVRLILEPGGHAEQTTAFDVTWEAVAPPRLEPHHFGRLDGRAFEDYRRFSQPGRVNGTVSVAGEVYEARDWFGARDHSWGVRRGVGGFEPFTGSMPAEAGGVLFIWLAFHAGEVSGLVQLRELASGERLMLDGAVWDGARWVTVTGLEHEITFRPGGRAFDRARIVLRGAGGEEWVVEAERSLTAWAYVGTGYDGGYNDGKGLGVWRGASLAEWDVYDVSDPEDVVLPDGKTIRPRHREQPVRLTVNGVAGHGHLPVMAFGKLPRYGLA
jgi:hypothetical protein